MKIINLEEFAALPDGTIFSPIPPRGGRQELHRKCPGGYNALTPVAGTYEGMDPTLEMQQVFIGVWLTGTRFCVYEPGDVQELIKAIIGPHKFIAFDEEFDCDEALLEKLRSMRQTHITQPRP